MNVIDKEKSRELSLRQRAEAITWHMLSAEANSDRFLSPAESQKVLHELRVHQIELEMQNQTLRDAQEALEESRDRYVDLYDFAPVGYLTLTDKGMIEEINLTAATLLGVERKKLQQHLFASLVVANDRTRWMTQFLNVLEKGDKGAVEVAIKRHDGTVFQAVLDCRRANLGDGEMAIRIALTNISERKQSEALHKDAVDRFRQLTQLVPGVVYQFRLRPDGSACMPYVSDAFRDMFHLDADEVREDANKALMRAHPDDVENFMASIQTSAHNMTPWQHEYRLKFDDGTVRWVFGNSQPQREADGSVLWHGFITDITERKQAEGALIESEFRWKFALEGAGDGVWDWNIQTGVAFYSRRYKKMLGFDEDEIGDTADEWTRRIHPDDAPSVMSALQPYMDGKPGSATVEFRMLCKDGSWQWTLGRGMVISRDTDGKPLRMIGTNTDITERRQAEEALRESELRFSLFMEYLPACAYIKDAQGRHTFANAALASQTEATAGPLLGKANGDLWPKEIAAKLNSADAAVIASRSPMTVEEDVLMNNAVRTYRTTKFPIERSNGETFLAGISFDITEHKQAEAELIQRERDIQSILNNMPSMIGYWDRNLLNRFGNHAYHTWFGIDEREMVGKHIREVIGEERYRLNLPYIEAALRGERQVFERDIPVPDGVGNRNALATYIPDYYEGEVRGFYVLVADVTPLKQAQAELEKYRNHLEELVADRTSELAQSRDAAEAGNHAKTIFLANMSHELHTPMNGVMGMIDLALRRAADPKQIDWLNKSKVAAQRLANVINDIIDFSKAEAERLPLDEKNFSLSRMIDDAMAMENLAAEAKGLRLTREIPATFPDLLSGDAFRVRQILLNFLGNACKFSDQGTITVRVSAAEQDGDSVLARIEVEDQGIGISPEQQATLFQAFTQVDGSMTRKYGGSGLGLVISKRLASLMGGDAGVVAQEGSGCTFWATVRLKSAKVGEVVI